MRKRPILQRIIMLFVLITFFQAAPVSGEENVADLKKQIEALQRRVDELEDSTSQSQRQDPWGFFQGRQNRPRDPFSEINRIQDEMNRMFQDSFHYRGNLGGGMFSNDVRFGYDYDFKENDDGYEIVFDMRGFDNETVDIEVNERSITVKGERREEEQEDNPQRVYRFQSYGAFLKTIPVPDDADTTKVRTEKSGDHLVIKLPKKIL